MFFIFLSFSSFQCPRHKCHKQKWHKLFSICIQLVARLLVYAHAITHIKCKRLFTKHCCIFGNFFLSTTKISQVHLFVWLFPIVYNPLNLVFLFNWKIFFTTELEKSLRLPCIKFNLTIISLKSDFHLSPHVAPGN